MCTPPQEVQNDSGEAGNMEEFWEFRYTVPRPAGDGLVKLTAAEAERLLLERVRDESVDRTEALGGSRVITSRPMPRSKLRTTCQ